MEKIWVDVPKFDGTNLVKLMAFNDAFNSVVKQDTRLSDVEKFMLLIEGLDGDARAMLASHVREFQPGLGIAERARYGRDELLVSVYMKALWELPGPTHDVRGITAFYDSVQAYTRSLDSLGEKEDSYGKLLVHYPPPS
jgi:hypothetical protein